MHTNYFTLAALAREWSERLAGWTFREAFSVNKGEVSLVFSRQDSDYSLRIGTLRPMQFAFGYAGVGRPRRNAPSFFEEASGRSVAAVRVAERDRHVFVDFEDGSAFDIMLFGSRANVVLVGADGLVSAAFRFSGRMKGAPPPEVRPAAVPPDARQLAEALDRTSGSLEKRVGRAIPLLDADLANEVIRVAQEQSSNLDPETLFGAWQRLRQRLDHPSPRIIRDHEGDRFSLIELGGYETVETFASVDEGVGAYVRRSLGRIAFEQRHKPLSRIVVDAAERAERRLEAMATELSQPSRADEYERFGHLLMASAGDRTSGLESVVLPDLFGSGDVIVPLDPTRSFVENAEQYYDRARRVRAARTVAESRFEAAIEAAQRWSDLRDRLASARTLADLDGFEREAEADLRSLRSASGVEGEASPYRLFVIDGFDVLVGKSATHNDRLTFGHARKHDLWLHARGVAGSHVVVRLDRGQTVPRPALEKIASLAAWYSKARGSGLVPVIVTERKFVRKQKGAHPGAVIVERETVLTVPPEVP